ncbi:hypothetical protein [Kaistia sp. MMO-174]|uniref:hypothetical protein n=1 Tax=Kaistia sp. MMO-174 TaxID=3081256 RepID=UPI003017D7F1
MEALPPPIATTPELTPVRPPPGSPDFKGSTGAPTLTAQPPEAPSQAPQPMTALEFLDPGRRIKTVPLKHPFHWDGKKVGSVSVRRLATAEVASWRERVAANQADSYDLYAMMTGLPAPVLRGLDSDDGDEVLAAAFDFLPRWLQQEEAASPAT